MKLYRENQNCSSFRPAEEVGGMEVPWSLLESKSYWCLESLNELIFFLALPLHLTLLHLQKNTGKTGVLLTLRHFAKPSVKMQSACMHLVDMHTMINEKAAVEEIKASTNRRQKFNILFTKMFTFFLEQV